MRRGTPIDRQGNRIESIDDAFQAQAHGRNIDLRQGAQKFEIAAQNLAQADELWPAAGRQTGFGTLQGEDGGLHVACQLQLLSGQGQALLDLGQRQLIPVASHILVQLLEHRLLALRFANLRLKRSEATEEASHLIVAPLDRARISAPLESLSARRRANSCCVSAIFCRVSNHCQATRPRAISTTSNQGLRQSGDC
ncbi:MAG: hypothetical protein V5B30_03320 [Candidatus Accumulibacter delftensis]|jgi:hypothetical protein